MKQSVIRILCALLLLAIALGIMAGVILAVPEKEDPQLWSRITFYTRGQQELRLYDGMGTYIATIATDKDGKGTTGLLEEGNYYGACRDGLVQFDLTELGIDNIRGRATQENKWSISLYGTAEPGVLSITGQARQEWYEYEVRSDSYSRRQVLRCKPGNPIQCTLEGLPYGSYTLLENGRTLCLVELSAEEPRVEVCLP